MSFVTDKQTLDDLNIPGKYRPDSVFSLFNKVVTGGGEKLLDNMFRNPFSNPAQINERAEAFQRFAATPREFPLAPQQFRVVENYLTSNSNGNGITAAIQVAWKKLLALIVRDEEYELLHAQLAATIEILNVYSDFLDGLDEIDLHNAYLLKLHSVKMIFKDPRFEWVKKNRGVTRLTVAKVAKYDHLLRSVLYTEVTAILDTIYLLDVLMAVSGVARAKNFSFALALPREQQMLGAARLRHPCIEKAVGNPVSFYRHSNVLFLTGANMAGKSTFMKSVGIALYLAHMGFPVAADNMQFSVKEGLYTSINVPDNLSQGYSHFYAEVLRVKTVAREISRPKDLFIIFDELFKGTNVKDAYDATLEITAAFAEQRHCFFIISTHITEAGEQLRKQCDNIQFVYFPSVLDKNKPVYTYQLQEGISNDRHGMMIIKNERILEMILTGTL